VGSRLGLGLELRVKRWGSVLVRLRLRLRLGGRLGCKNRGRGFTAGTRAYVRAQRSQRCLRVYSVHSGASECTAFTAVPPSVQRSQRCLRFVSAHDHETELNCTAPN